MMTEIDESTFGSGRYLVLAGCFLGLAAGYSSTYFYSSGLFLLPVAETFGVSRGEASLGPLICTLAAAGMIPLFGRLLDRIGAVPIALLSLIGLAAGFTAMAGFANGFGSYLFCSFLIAVLGTGSTALPYSRLVVLTFARRRGMALGVMLTGTGVGAMTVPLVVIPAIRAYGWRATYGGMAVAVLAAAIVVAVLILPMAAKLGGAARQRLAAADLPNGRRPSPLAVWTSTRFLLIGGTFFCLATSIISVVFHFVPMLTDAGVPPGRAAAMAAAIGFSSIAGRLVIGFLLDWIAAEALTLMLLGVALAAVLMLASGDATLALPGGMMLGLVVGAEMDMLAFFTARFFGTEVYGTAYGGLFSLFLIGGAIGPSLTGYLYDFAHSYQVALLFSMALLAAAAVLMAMLWRFNRRATA